MPSAEVTVLLQLNSDQQATQFKDAVRAYFAPPVGMVETDRGCLLFVNNASPSHGRSETWGRSKLHFSFSERFRILEPPAPTFWLQEDGPHDYQAIVLRESGPGLYWLKYKPRYLVNVMPGAGQAGPFPNEHALFAAIENAQLQLAPPAELFKHLPAICHWLDSEWTDEKLKLRSNLQDNGRAPEIIDHCLERYEAAKADWIANITPGDFQALKVVDLLFSCMQDRPAYPPKQSEPQLWCDQACQGARRMIWAYALFSIATQPRGPMKPDPAPTHHALLGETMAITLLWGADSVFVDPMVSKHLARLQQYGAGETLYSEHALILINPNGTLAREELRNTVKRLSKQVQVGDPPDAAGRHLRQGGEAVSVQPSPEIRCLFASDLYGALQATTPEDLSRGLQDIVTGALYAE